jgi:3-methyladenine DNA glycosylase Mpg
LRWRAVETYVLRNAVTMQERVNVFAGPVFRDKASGGVKADPLYRGALEPTHDLDVMSARRGLDDPRLLCSGPGRLTQALGITSEHDGADVTAPPFELLPPLSPVEVERSSRIGISQAADKPWRYVETGSRWTSRARRATDDAGVRLKSDTGGR